MGRNRVGEEKECTECERVLPLSSFRGSFSKKRGHTSYRGRCKACEKGAKRRQYIKDADKNRVYQKKHYRENEEEIRRKRREGYVSRMPEGFVAKTRREIDAARRAREYNAETDNWTVKEVMEESTGFCPYCGKHLGHVYDGSRMHLDHIVPLFLGGPNCRDNIEPICGTCNQGKGIKSKEEYLEYLARKT